MAAIGMFRKIKITPDCAMKDIRVLAGHIVVVVKPGDFFSKPSLAESMY